MTEFIFDEQLYIVNQKYFDDCDTNYLVELIRSNTELTAGTRKFIADVLEGKVKRKRGGRKSNPHRDLEIACKIYSLINKGTALTSNRDIDGVGAAAIVADEYEITEDAALKIYQRKIPEIKWCIKADHEAWQGFMDEDPDLFP